MPIYVATCAAVAVTAAQDVFELVTHATSRVRIKEIRLGQYTDFGDAAAEMLSVLVIRGNATSGSGGSTATPVNLSPLSGALAAVTVVEINNTTVASTGSPVTLVADAWNIQRGWLWRARCKEEEIEVGVSSRLVVRITAPADSITLNGTIVFEETGKSATA